MEILNKLKFDYTLEEITGKVDSVIQSSLLFLDELSKTEEIDCSFSSILARFADHETELDLMKGCLQPLKSLHPNEDIRKAAKKALGRLSNHISSFKIREELYGTILKAEKNSQEIEDVDRLFINNLKLDFERSGLKENITKEERILIQEVFQNMFENNSKFMENYEKERDSIKLIFTKEELKGCWSEENEDFLKMIEEKNGKCEEGGKYIITLKDSDLRSVLGSCEVEKTRERIYNSYQTIASETDSPKLLDENVHLRKKLATLLGGYDDDYSKYRLSVRMAGKKEKVTELLNSVEEKVNPVWERDISTFLKLKREETQNPEAELYAHDLEYYGRIRAENLFKINLCEVQDYFPADRTIPLILGFFGRLFGIKLNRVDPEKLDPRFTWHKDVEIYEVEDLQSEKIVSVVYLDLFEREGKSSGWFAKGLQPSCYSFCEKKRQVPIGMMVCNISSSKPALMTMKELETFCHEFGHLLHTALCLTKYSRFSGENVLYDFVEVPSQTLEFFVNYEEFLCLVSCHSRTSSKLPKEMAKKISKVRRIDRTKEIVRLIYRSRFDLMIHELTGIESQKLYVRLQSQSYKVIIPETNNGSTGFIHMMYNDEQYDVGYYTYLWSDVIACDLISVFFDPTIRKEKKLEDCIEEGMRLRKEVLSKGGEKDPNLCVQEFLGRRTTDDEFCKTLVMME